MPKPTVALKISREGYPDVAFPEIEWQSDMNGQDALERAFDSHGAATPFDFVLRYYGAALGYMVVAIDDVSDEPPSAGSKAWMFYVNDLKAPHGIDHEVLEAGDSVMFRYEAYSAAGLAAPAKRSKFV